MRVVRQRTWLIATVVALFGLLAPPCVFACLERLEDESSATQLAEPPCHEQDPDSIPSEAPRSSADCACEFDSEVLLHNSKLSSSAGALVVISPRALCQPLDASTHWAFATLEGTGLPSPDILLLKSTLLI